MVLQRRLVMRLVRRRLLRLTPQHLETTAMGIYDLISVSEATGQRGF